MSIVYGLLVVVECIKGLLGWFFVCLQQEGGVYPRATNGSGCLSLGL